MRLPEFFTKLSPIGETLEAMEAGRDLMARETELRNRRLSVSTADGKGLSLWEADYSLPDGGDRGDGYRRAQVRTAMAGGRTLTPEELTVLAAGLSGADQVTLEEDFAHWRVRLGLLYADRAPGDLSALMAAVEKLKPAHLDVEVAPSVELRGTVTRYAALTGSVYLEAWDE